MYLAKPARAIAQLVRPDFVSGDGWWSHRAPRASFRARASTGRSSSPVRPSAGLFTQAHFIENRPRLQGPTAADRCCAARQLPQYPSPVPLADPLVGSAPVADIHREMPNVGYNSDRCFWPVSLVRMLQPSECEKVGTRGLTMMRFAVSKAPLAKG